MSTPKTLYDKIWNDHLVSENEDGTSIIYIDRHLVHEVTSPQAFEGLKIANRSVRKPNFTLATADHTIFLQQIEMREYQIQSLSYR